MKNNYLKLWAFVLICFIINACSKSDIAPDNSPVAAIPTPPILTKPDTSVSAPVKTDTVKSTSGTTTTPSTGTSNTGSTTTPTTGTGNTTTNPSTGTTTTPGKTTTPTTGTGTTGGTTTPATGTTNTGGITTPGKTTTPATGTVNTNPGKTTTPSTGTGATTTPSTGTAPTTPVTTKPPVTTPKPLTYKLSAPMVLDGAHNLTIRGDSINGGALPCIKLMNCTNIRITKCKLMNSRDIGVFIWNSSGITVDSCYISKVATGVFALECPKGSIQVNNNQMLNMVGPYPKGDFVQFSAVGGPNNLVSYNKCENIYGQSTPEDGISMYKSNGQADSPIKIIGNWIRGGGPSTTGSGITLGDQGGSYEVAENNIVVNSGNIGMQVAGGNHIQIINNSITSSAFSWSHLGLGCGNYSGLPSSNITISGNKIKWISGKPADQLRGSSSIEKDISYQAGTTIPTGWSTNIINAEISTSILPVIIINK